MLTAIIMGLILVGLGYAQQRNQIRLQKAGAQLSPEQRRRMLTIFVPAMVGLIALTFVLIFLLRPHA